MKLYSVSTVVALLSAAPLIAAQTYTSCNPLHASCPADPAFGKSGTFDFTSGASSEWTPSGSPTYGSKGAQFQVAKHGDSPLITSNWYIMFGHVEFVIQAAPGTGIVSSAVLQSDDLDEIDWEFLGGDGNNVQTNYFGKGDTSVYNREATFAAANNNQKFHTYTIDWTQDHVVWAIDGTTVRTLTPANADANQYPQTPMMIKVGAWAGGDSSNPQGTIQWAGGVTDYGAGPFNMYVQSISVTDYSTGSKYQYTDETGDWKSIQAVGGSVNGNAGGAPSVVTSATVPGTTSAATGEPVPFSGTHRETSSFSTPSTWPWVPTSTSGVTDSAPSGYSSTGTGAVSGTSQPTSASASGSGSSSPSGGSSSLTTVVVSTTTGGSSSSASTSVAAAPSAASAINMASVRALAALCAVFVGALILL